MEANQCHGLGVEACCTYPDQMVVVAWRMCLPASGYWPHAATTARLSPFHGNRPFFALPGPFDVILGMACSGRGDLSGEQKCLEKDPLRCEICVFLPAGGWAVLPALHEHVQRAGASTRCGFER
jgi:hypothetical protein